MESGRLRHIVRFERFVSAGQDPATGEDLGGGWEAAKTDSGIDLSMVPAEVLTGAGRERFIQGVDWGEVAARINTRWFPADEIEMSKWRIVWVTPSGINRVYGIIGPPETDATGCIEWRFRCNGGVNDG